MRRGRATGLGRGHGLGNVTERTGGEARKEDGIKYWLHKLFANEPSFYSIQVIFNRFCPFLVLISVIRLRRSKRARMPSRGPAA